MSEYTFRDEQEAVTYERLEAQMLKMPVFVQDYVEESKDALNTSTLLQYTYDLENFLTYLVTHDDRFSDTKIYNFKLNDIKLLTYKDISQSVKWYRHPDHRTFRKPRTINRYLATLSSLFSFYVKRGKLDQNPVTAVRRSSVPRKEINRLHEGEKERYMSAVMSGEGLSDKQKEYHEAQWLRDYTIIRILLYTGIRVSELAGLNRSDINFKEHSLRVIRKGGDIDYVYFDDETEAILKEYLYERDDMKLTDDEDALFISRKQNRLSVRAIERMVKKYQKSGLPMHQNGLTPHRLRATFATDLYSKTGDLYLTSKAMGHKSISTTTIYAEVADEQKKAARNKLIDIQEA